MEKRKRHYQTQNHNRLLLTLHQCCAVQSWVWVVFFLLPLSCVAAIQNQIEVVAQQEGLFHVDSSAALGSPQPLDTLWSDTKSVFTEGVEMFSAPLRFDAAQWVLTGSVVTGTGLLMIADHEVREAFTEKQDTLRNRLSNVGNYYGTLVPGLVVSSGLYAGGLIFDEPSVRRAGRHIFQAMLYAGAITTVAKMLIGRHRPFLNEGQYMFDGPSLKDEYFSLPSGHSTVAFSISSTLAAEIDHPAATVALYSLAALTAASRIYSDRHWLSDTFLGAAIGTACGYGVVHLKDDLSSGSSSWMILPTNNGIRIGWSGIIP